MVHWATKSQKSEAYWLKNKEHEVYKNDNFLIQKLIELP